ncbi:MAG: P-loop containing nucleoside triphosphate hydrolase protein [Linnemannia gamsii]|nr:MAG: P-loop containing nucleoside triphosphate hydrolase protein [Linnemannia gamsii]
MFDRDSAYQSIVEKIYRIQGHLDLTDNVCIPLLTIIGDQSSGKSSCLEALTKLPFPRNNGMCTRFAIQVNLRRNSELTEDRLTARIEGQDVFNERNKHPKSPTEFESVIAEAITAVCRSDFDVSNKMLELTLSGPTQSPLTLIDLPGFINQVKDKHPNDLRETIRDINERYIKDPRTIILAVMPSNIDFESSTVLTEAKKHDPDGKRTIPIVTKPDLMTNSEQWMDVILNQSSTMPLGYLVMCSGIYEANQSWDYALTMETAFFSNGKWSQVPDKCKGRVAVKEFLGDLLCQHITKELPAFKREVRIALNKFKRSLKAMGTPIKDKAEAKDKLTRANLKLQQKMIRFLNADYDSSYIVAYLENSNITSSDDGDDDEDDDNGGKDDDNGGEDDGDDEDIEEAKMGEDCEDSYFVRSSLLRYYHSYCSAMKGSLKRVSYTMTEKRVARYKGNDPPGFVSFITFRNIYKGHYLPGWKTATNKYVDKMHIHLSEALRNFIKHTADEATGKVFRRVFSQFSRDQEEEIKKTIHDIFQDEEMPFSLSRQFVEAIHQERSKNNRIPALPIEQSVTEMNEGLLPQASEPRSPDSPRPSQSIISTYSSLEPQPKCDWNDMLSAKAFVPCLLAYLTTALERIVDMVLMQTIERHMVRRIDKFFDMVCDVKEEDLGCMLESSALVKKRNDLEIKIADFESLLDDL